MEGIDWGAIMAVFALLASLGAIGKFVLDQHAARIKARFADLRGDLDLAMGRQDRLKEQLVSNYVRREEVDTLWLDMKELSKTLSAIAKDLNQLIGENKAKTAKN